MWHEYLYDFLYILWRIDRRMFVNRLIIMIKWWQGKEGNITKPTCSESLVPVCTGAHFLKRSKNIPEIQKTHFHKLERNKPFYYFLNNLLLLYILIPVTSPSLFSSPLHLPFSPQRGWGLPWKITKVCHITDTGIFYGHLVHRNLLHSTDISSSFFDLVGEGFSIFMTLSKTETSSSVVV